MNPTPGVEALAISDDVDVLVVDDRPDQLVALSAVFEDLQVRVHAATSGREALRLLLKRDFAIILLDVNMPGMDGFELASLIRERPRSADTPIIFVSAASELDTHVTHGYSLGAVDYIHVPVVPEILRTKVGVFVDLYRKSVEIQRKAAALRDMEAREHRRQLAEAMQRLEHEARQVEVLREEQRRAALVQRLTSASLSINAARSVEETLEAVAGEARTLLRGSRAWVWIRGEGNAAPKTAAEPSRPSTSGSVDPELAILHARVAELNRVLRFDDGQLDQHAVLAPLLQRLAAEDRPRTWLSAPLVGRDGRNLGFVLVLDSTAGRFGTDEESLAVRLAELASVAIENLLYREAREANRLKDEFLAMLSHELRTPLSAMLGWTQLLRSGRLDVANRERAIEVIERNLKTQAQLIEDLLDMSRIVNGKLRIEPAALALRPLIVSSIDALRPVVAARDVLLTLDVEPFDACIWGDASRLQQIVWNLLSNANKFTPSGGRIDVTLRRVAGFAELRVQDTGEGIDPELLPVIFDRFTQAETSLTRSHGGLGLGLTIAQHLVEIHGGTIHADSAGRGLGSCFTVRLPVFDGVAATATAAASLGGRPEPASLNGTNVLLVDDDPDTREMVAAALVTLGATVTTASSALEASRVLEAAQPHVIVCDISMPGEDGYSFVRRLRAGPPTQGGRTPAIALTAFADPRSRSAAIEAGYQIHLAKPVDHDQLALAVAALANAPNGDPARGDGKAMPGATAQGPVAA